MPEHYDMDEKIQAAIAWLITGTSEEASKLCGVPGRTIRYWQNEPWWEDILDEAKGIKQKELDALYTGMIHRVTDELNDRIKNGDSFVTKFGDLKKIPVKAKDLSIILDIAVKNRSMLRGQATQRIEKITIDQKLEKIGVKFEEVATPINDEAKAS